MFCTTAAAAAVDDDDDDFGAARRPSPHLIDRSGRLRGSEKRRNVRLLLLPLTKAQAQLLVFCFVLFFWHLERQTATYDRLSSLGCSQSKLPQLSSLPSLLVGLFVIYNEKHRHLNTHTELSWLSGRRTDPSHPTCSAAFRFEKSRGVGRGANKQAKRADPTSTL